MTVYKRYQTRTRDSETGQVKIDWTPWFKTRYKPEQLEELRKTDKWQEKNKLLNEFKLE